MAQLGNNEIVPGFDDGRDAGVSIILERTDADPGCLKIHLAGRIDTYNSSDFHKSADKLIAAGFRFLVFCCANLVYVSSAGIGALMRVHEAAKAQGGEMFMVDLQPQVYDVFNILGYTTYFSFRETAEDAIENLRLSSARRGAASMTFPLPFPCPKCKTKLTAKKPGKFLCSSCKARLVVDERGGVKLWSEDDELGSMFSTK
jgi:anti-sigma B factor antagonist